MSEKIHLTAQKRFSLPDDERQNVTRFCPKCGREIPLDRKICAFCENTGKIPRPILPKKEKVKLILLISVVFLFLLLLTLFLTRKTGLKPDIPTPLSPVRGTPVAVTVMP